MKMKELKQKLYDSSDDLIMRHCYFVSLPTLSAHSGSLPTLSAHSGSLPILSAHSGHSIGIEAGLNQRVSPYISRKSVILSMKE